MVNWLKKLLISLFFIKKPASVEKIQSRFITSKSHFSKTKLMAKYHAFLPMLNKVSNRWETSIFQINDLTEEKIWELAEENITKKSGRSVYARADLFTLSITVDGELSVEADNNPPKHANIIGWPEKKHERQHLANKLASRVNKLLIKI